MNVAELEGAVLDAAVAKAEGLEFDVKAGLCYTLVDTDQVPEGSWWLPFHPSSSWFQGGAIIERERITITAKSDYWECSIPLPTEGCEDWCLFIQGPTPLVAAMRAFVAKKLDENVAEQPK